MHKRKAAVGLVWSIVLVLALAACGGQLGGLTGSDAAESAAEAVAEVAPQSEPEVVEIPVVQVEMGDAGPTLPDTIPSGVVAFEHVNGASVLPARLNDGVTLEQFQEGLMVDEGMGAISLVTLMGNAQMTADGQVIYDLPAGEYVGVQFSEDAPPGVVPFSTGEASGAAAPEADVEVEFRDFAFTIPEEISTGPQVWKLTNMGEQWHEMAVFKVAEGVQPQDLLEMMMSEDESEGEPPAEMVAFWEPNSPGQSAWATWDLEPGEYTVVCFLPDLAGDFTPHLAHGMVAQFTVTP